MESIDAVRPVKGRPRKFDPEQALAAALQVFWRRGYEGASVAELAAEMGIAKPSLYATFGNKEALFRKALDLYEREKRGYTLEALAQPTSRSMAEHLLQSAVDMQTAAADPKGCMGVINSMPCGPEASAIRECVLEREELSRRALIGRLEHYRRQGDLPEDIEPEALSRYVMAVVQGLSLQASAGASRRELDSVVDLAVRSWPGH